MEEGDAQKSIRGACLCGAVVFECVGAPVHFNLCHCTMCQKFHGAMLGPYVWFKAAQVTMVQGHEYESIYDSSQWASRSFCRRCGSSLRYIYHKEPDMRFMAAGIFEGDIGLKPVRHIFVKDKCAWFEIEDGLPQVASWVQSGLPEVVAKKTSEDT